MKPGVLSVENETWLAGWDDFDRNSALLSCMIFFVSNSCPCSCVQDLLLRRGLICFSISLSCFFQAIDVPALVMRSC